MRRFLETFRTPGPEYRGVPFWAWNGKLDIGELRRQIRGFRDAGMGGFFMHSRVGLDTPYLGKAWFRCVRACIEEARACGLKAWLYDEDRWPSGAAGGRVTRDPRYRQRRLCLEMDGPAPAGSEPLRVLAAFAGRVDGPRARDLRRLPGDGKSARLRPGERRLAFGWTLAAKDDWFNGEAYLDALNPRAVRRFLDLTHEAYRKRFARCFGRLVPGVFTDEPNHGPKGGAPPSFPWTGRLPSVFRRVYGYDLIPHLPEIFFEVEGLDSAPVRWHYHDCVTRLFCDAFARQIGEWCGRNGLLSTGHVLLEDTLASQTNVVGSAMRFYEHMQAPGMDLLTERWRIYDAAKQVSSAARQSGARWRLTETYGCTGWDFPFAGHKALGDWQAALGLNLRAPHLAWYTMLGEAKRDYPAAISHQSPWWDAYRAVEEYFARVHAVLSGGREVRDLLVIHPVESAWIDWTLEGAASPRQRALQTGFCVVREALLRAHLDFDYGDEDILARRGSVGRGPVLRVGRAVYRAALVPPVSTLRSTTLRLLSAFRRRGGETIFAGGIPGRVDARPSTAAAAFAETCRRVRLCPAALARAAAGTRRISVADARGREIPQVLYQLREDRDAFRLFLCNTGYPRMPDPEAVKGDPPVRDRSLALADARVRGFAGCEGAPVELDPETGRAHRADASRDGGGWTIRTHFPALGSRLFLVPKRGGKPPAPLLPARRPVRGRALPLGPPPPWPIRLSEPNVLVLDAPLLQVNGSGTRAPIEILRADREVRKRLGLKPRGGAMVQPWVRKPERGGPAADVELRFRVELREIPAGTVWLALERPDLYGIRLNGEPIPGRDSGWWVDRSLRRIPLAHALWRKGPNEIRLRCRYDAAHPGLEAVFLLGDFGVYRRANRWVVGRMPDRLRPGDWTAQGLPFYAGHVSYLFRAPRPVDRGRCLLRVGRFSGVAVRLRLDGREAGILGWPPYEANLAPWLHDRPRELAVEILGHRRNSHGPLHHRRKWPDWTGPGEFVTTGSLWTDSHQLVPCGLMAPPVRIRPRESVDTLPAEG